jgi:hypothetical protein
MTLTCRFSQLFILCSPGPSLPLTTPFPNLKVYEISNENLLEITRHYMKFRSREHAKISYYMKFQKVTSVNTLCSTQSTEKKW